MFSGHTVPPDSKETKFGSSNQEVQKKILLTGENTGVVLVPYCAWKGVPTAISNAVVISEVPGCHFLGQMRVTKIT